MCMHNDWFGMLLVGKTEPVAVRPVSMHAIYGTPVYQDRPQEQEAGNVHSTASTAVLDPQDANAWSTIPVICRQRRVNVLHSGENQRGGVCAVRLSEGWRGSRHGGRQNGGGSHL